MRAIQNEFEKLGTAHRVATTRATTTATTSGFASRGV